MINDSSSDDSIDLQEKNIMRRNIKRKNHLTYAGLKKMIKDKEFQQKYDHICEQLRRKEVKNSIKEGMLLNLFRAKDWKADGGRELMQTETEEILSRYNPRRVYFEKRMLSK